MKKLVTVLILCSVFNSFSQADFNRAYHNGGELVVPVLIDIAKCTYFTSRTTSITEQQYLYKHDQNGNLKFRIQLPFPAQDMIKTIDQQLYITGKEFICSDMFPAMMAYKIAKVDTTGNLVFAKSFTLESSQDFRTSLHYTSDSSYFSFSYNSFYRFNKTGQLIASGNMSLNVISSALVLPNGNILLSAQQNANNVLVVMSPNGAILSSTPFQNVLEKMSFYKGQQIMGLSLTGILYKISPSLALIGSSTYSTGVSVRDFVCKNDSVYSIVKTSGAPSNYAISDTSFNFLSVTTTTTQEVYQKAICLNNNRVAIIADGTADAGTPGWGGSGTHYFTSLSQISKTSSNNFLSEVSIRSLEADSMYSDGISTFFRAKVRVKNTGSIPVTSFKLNCFRYGTTIACGRNYYGEVFSQLNLSPGDSVTVVTSFVEKYLGIYPVPTPPYTTTLSYCFYSTLPNGETDQVYGNNKLCDSYVLSVLSLNEISKDNYNWNVFPNPFTNAINVQSEGGIGKISLSNTLGMEVKTWHPEQKDFTLNTGELPAGVYFVSIETKKGKFIKKVLKD